LTTTGSFDFEVFTYQTEASWSRFVTEYNSLASLYILTMTSIKLSILFLYRRTFTLHDAWFRWCWWTLLTLVILWTVTCSLLLALVVAGKTQAYEFPRLAIAATGVINTFLDVLFLILLGLMIARMKLQKNQKVALVIIFGMGGLYVTFSSL
jgi:hypothetical protein